MRYKWVLRMTGIVFCVLVGVSLIVSVWKNKMIDSRLGFNMVVLGDDRATVMSYKPENLSVDYVDLPDSLKIDLFNNGSDFGIGELREAEKKTAGSASLNDFRRGLSLELGIPIPIIIRHKTQNDPLSLRDSLLAWGGADTNMKFIDRMEVIKILGLVLAKGLNLNQPFPSRLTDRVVEIDGGIYQKANEAVFSWAKNYFLSEAVLSETVEVVVMNASGIPGLGRKVSRQFETAGMRVIDVRTGNYILDKRCEVDGDREAHPLTMNYLVNYFGCEIITDYPGKNQGTEIVVIVGKNY